MRITTFLTVTLLLNVIGVCFLYDNNQVMGEFFIYEICMFAGAGILSLCYTLLLIIRWFINTTKRIIGWESKQKSNIVEPTVK